MRAYLLKLFAIFLGFYFFLWGFSALGFRIVTTPSVPVGLWKVTSAREPKRGQTVWLCPPDNNFFKKLKASHYYGAGSCPGKYQHLMKPIVGIPGDKVVIGPQGITVNGTLIQNSKALKLGGFGLPIASGAYRVMPGTVWLISSYNPKSLDSRYFGPIPFSKIEGVASPVWVH